MFAYLSALFLWNVLGWTDRYLNELLLLEISLFLFGLGSDIQQIVALEKLIFESVLVPDLLLSFLVAVGWLDLFSSESLKKPDDIFRANFLNSRLLGEGRDLLVVRKAEQCFF